ncbi:MAG: replicative DNA helicase [Candidatus Latescibacteria bacterium]|jgi:replicative DNA helicase|nr:replicative DNA helicase [Candidatus Latescibacterota bacterium]
MAYDNMGAENVRPMPNAVAVEREVLGAMLLNKEAIAKAASVLTADSFYHSAHKDVFEAILHLHNKDQAADAVGVIEVLRSKSRLERVGGERYVMRLVGEIATTANVEDHAEIIQRHSIRRDLIALGDRISRQSFDDGCDVIDTISDTQNELFRQAERGLRKGFIQIEDVLHDTFEDLDRLHQEGGEPPGVPTGYGRLDELTTGLQASDLIIIAGRPSMGKTSFALNVAQNVALDHGIGVGIFSLEMSARQLSQRLLCAAARIDSHSVRQGHLGDEDWARLCAVVGDLSEAPIHIDDSPTLTPVEARAKARTLATEHGVGLIIVDYMQLMHAPGAAESRQLEIATISRSLKALAKELNVPVVALSQLSRAVEQRGGDHRPKLSDLRESGSIEQDADVVAFVHRPERFASDPDEREELSGQAEIIVEKQRNGPTGTVQLTWVDKFARFENPALWDEPTGDDAEF